MNKLSLIVVLCASVFSATAQSSYNTAGANGINTKDPGDEEMSTVVNKDPFYSIDFSLKGDKVFFTNLPADKHLRVYITNADGVEEYSKKLNIESSIVNLKGFDKGLHYITVISKDNKRKAFKINL